MLNSPLKQGKFSYDAAKAIIGECSLVSGKRELSTKHVEKHSYGTGCEFVEINDTETVYAYVSLLDKSIYLYAKL